MIIGKVILIVFVIFLAFCSDVIYAQNSKPPKFSILKDDKSIIFREGETVIVEVKFTGFDSDYEEYNGAFGKPLYESEVLKLFRENRATISADEKFSSKKIEKVIKLLKEWLAAAGYLKAEVVAFGEKLPKNQMKLIFSVERGAMIHVSEIRFVGNRNITSQEFTADFKQCSGDSWERFERRIYDYFSRKCSQSLMFGRGYFQSRIKRITPQLFDDNYVVTIEVNEGMRYRIGEMKIEGATVFTDKEILEMLGQKEGDVADGKLLQDFFYEKLKRVYADKGYILYNAEFDPEFIKPQVEGLDGVVNIKGTIDEGKAFKVAKIEFIGIEKEKAQQLKEILSLKEGEIYNQSKFEDGMKKINETKEYYFIDNNRDTDWRIDEDSGDFSITIKVSKIQ